MAPTNDDIQNAIRIYNPSGSDVQAIETATLQPGEPPHAGETKSVWYVYVARTRGTFTFSVSGTSVTVFRYISDMFPTATNFSDLTSTVSISVVPGDVRYFQVMQ